MKTPIIQFGTSRFLQAHIDLFIHESIKNKKAAGYITVVQTTNNINRANRLKNLSKGYIVHIKGYKNKVVINEYIIITLAFYERNESSLVNGVLDRIAKIYDIKNK